MEFGWIGFGIFLGISLSKAIDKCEEGAKKKVEEVEADIVREETIKALDKVKEELEKEK
mgnify:FL=1|tara:strand:- start:21 stop:197 length:177 start_codon:yes stop_codon:yes gene_type:complete